MIHKVRVRATAYPTEDVEKIKQAIQKLFPSVKIEEKHSELVGIGEGKEALLAFREALRRQAILDTARNVLCTRKQQNKLFFMLNKQAAYVGAINFTNGESGLGPINIEIETENVKKVIDWLAPPTEAGKPTCEVNI